MAVAALVLVSGTARAQPDPWFGADQAMHFSISSAAAIFGYGTSAVFLDSPKKRLVYGASVAFLAGVGKELWDASGKNGDPSVKDLAWDALGAVVGLAICLAIDQLFFEAPRPQTN